MLLFIHEKIIIPFSLFVVKITKACTWFIIPNYFKTTPRNINNLIDSNHRPFDYLNGFFDIIDEFFESFFPVFHENFLCLSSQIGIILLVMTTLLGFLMFVSLVAFFVSKPLFKISYVNFLMKLAEQEFNSSRDLVILSGFISVASMVPSVFFLWGSFVNIFSVFFIINITNLIFITLIIPVMLTVGWGSYFTAYIKGQSIKKSIFLDLLTDYVHVLSFFLRIYVQLIRCAIITVVLFLYTDMYLEFIYPTLGKNQIKFDFNFLNSCAMFLIELSATILYEIGHLWISLGMQSGAFTLIILVITQFLYSIYMLNKIQNYLIFKRRN